MRRLRILPVLFVASLCGLFAAATLPTGVESGKLLTLDDDPSAIADHALNSQFDAGVARYEIEQALAAGDAELAQSFVDLAKDRGVPVDPALAARVAAATAEQASAMNTAGRFTRGLIVGEPDDLASLAGTALGDLFVFGDIRDVVREGSRLASGEKADELILGLACVGIAVTAGTYMTVGVAAPVRIGVSLVKAARKTGRIGARMGRWLGRALREVVDMTALRRVGANLASAEPAAAARAVREVVKVEKSQELMTLARNVGTIQAKAGTRAALEGLKVAQGPRDVARIAKLAEKQGGKTRAILKLLGRGAIWLTMTTWTLLTWVVWVVMMVFGFVSSLKSATERSTLRYVRWRKARRARRMALAQMQALATAPAAGYSRPVVPTRLSQQLAVERELAGL